MIDRRVVCNKLSQLRERLQTLRVLAAEPLGQFSADPVKRGAAERLLQVSIEICLDVGHHLIARLNLPRPTEYRDVFRILGERKILAPDFAARLEKMAAFRNRLVHLYAEIEPAQVHEYLQNNLPDFDEFARVVAAVVKEPKAK